MAIMLLYFLWYIQCIYIINIYIYLHIYYKYLYIFTTMTGSECKTFCSDTTSFTCVAVYRRPGYCFATWIRVEEDIDLYSQYYTNDNQVICG
jgi:hypothetical protein